MSAPEEWDDIRRLEAEDRRADRRDRMKALLVLALICVGAAVALIFGGSIA